jgi:hypothetical protein
VSDGFFSGSDLSEYDIFDGLPGTKEHEEQLAEMERLRVQLDLRARMLRWFYPALIEQDAIAENPHAITIAMLQDPSLDSETALARLVDGSLTIRPTGLEDVPEDELWAEVARQRQAERESCDS